jgi:Ni/Fe-hydrogenase subunit HybB-like protein
MVTPTHSRYRLGLWKAVFLLIVAAGLVATAVRMTQGLGAVTNLSDKYPWGLWKGFNVLVAIGLGGAGFTIMAMVHVFHVKQLRPIARPALVMAFLAYASAAGSLVLDIGRPWAIWHPIVMWNPDSVLFEVAWCLMLYTGVLLLEGSGMIFEKLGWERLARAQHLFTLPIVMAGVVLSTLHQSSLGALFLIVPDKLHGLWYTELLPLLFIVSAVCMGIAMVIILSRITARVWRRRLEMPILDLLGRILVVALWTYGALRLVDLAYAGSLPLAFAFTYEAGMFNLELFLGVILPGTLLAIPSVRNSPRRLYGASLCVVAGFVIYRLNVSVTGFEAALGGHYVPTWSEMAITVMVIALAFWGFAIAVRYLDVYPRSERQDPGTRIRRLVPNGNAIDRPVGALGQDSGVASARPIPWAVRADAR